MDNKIDSSSCSVCSKIPSELDLDLIDTPEDPRLSVIAKLSDVDRDDFFGPTKSWNVKCNVCETVYRLSVNADAGDLPGLVRDFSLRRLKKDHGQGRDELSKDDFADKFDFDSLSCATIIRVFMKNGDTHLARVLNYWPCAQDMTDYVEAEPMKDSVKWKPIESDKDTMDGDFVVKPENARYDFHVPNPDIDHIEILESISTPNHGSHPEILFICQKLSNVYKGNSN